MRGDGRAERPLRIGVSALRWMLGAAAVALMAWAAARVIWRETSHALAKPHGIELTVLHWSGEGGPEEDEIVERSLRQFEADNPGVRVRRINPGDAASFYTKLQTMMASGAPPDVFYVGSERIPSFGSLGLLEPLQPYLDRDAARGEAHALDLAEFYPQVVDAFRWNGTRVGEGALLGIPKDFTTVGFYYNKDLFQRAGIAYPTDDWTWDDFIRAARAVGALKDDSGERFTGAEFVTWPAMVRAYLMTEGTDVRGRDFNDVTLRDPATFAALDRLRAWRHDEQHALTSGRSKLATGAPVFSTGRVGMAGPFGRWVVPEYRRIRDFDWDFAPLPRGKERANIILTVAWALSTQCEHKEEAWKLVRWLTNAEGQAAQARLGLAIPSNRSVAESGAFVDPQSKPANDQGYLRAIPSARVVDWPVNPRFEQLLGSRLDQGLKTADLPLADAIAQFEDLWAVERASPLASVDHPRMPWGAIATVCVTAAACAAGGMLIAWRRRRLPPLEARDERAGMAMVAPWVLGFLIFMAFPIVLSLLLSLTSWRGLSTLSEARWVGVGNYTQLAQNDQTFLTSVLVTLYFVAVAVPAGQAMALGAALVLRQKLGGIALYRAAFYLPSVLAGVGVAVLWRWVFDTDNGLMNSALGPVLTTVGLAPPDWFGKNAGVAGAPAFAIMNMWFVGGSMLIYLAGLQGIPDDLHEAAGVDGVRRLRRFWSITLPMLSPVILFNCLMALIGSFQVFTQAFVMTGGEPGDLTRFYVLYLFNQGFEFYNMGYASAMAWILLLLVLVVTVIILRSSARFIYTEAPPR